jgi:hypothetical protein
MREQKTGGKMTKKMVGVFMITAGVILLGLLAYSMKTGGGADTYSAFTHLLAEFASGMMMIIEGLHLAASKIRMRKSALYALGMFIYSVLQSSGIYLERGDYLVAALFVVLLGLALTAVRWLMRLGQDTPNPL